MTALRVLVIDDSLTIRGIMEALLEKTGGCKVIGTASDIAAARALMVDHAPDVITLDLALPGTDGLTFLAELETETHPPVVVVSSSTVAESDIVRQAVALGAAACFDKALLVKQGAQLVRLLRIVVMDHLRARLAALERLEKRERALFG